MKKEEIVEYVRLRPRELVKRREEMPVAYIGLGVLEWHGFHNPLGLDGIKANGIACLLAKKLGGVVMPPQYWGEVRRDLCEMVADPAVSKWLPAEISCDHTMKICSAMKLKKNDFEEDAKRSASFGEWELYENLLLRMFFQTETLGFRAIITLPGHFPLIAPAARAVEKYERQGGKARIFILEDHMYAPDGRSGDHAAAFETSLMMALCPELVDMSELGEDLSEPNIGVIGPDPRKYAGVKFGNQILNRFEEIAHNFIKSAFSS